VGIHVTTMRHTEFRKYKKNWIKEQLVDIMGYICFFTKKVYMRILSKEEIHYCTARKYSTETVINASRLINKFDHCYS